MSLNRRKFLRYTNATSLICIAETAGLFQPNNVHANAVSRSLFDNNHLMAVLSGVSLGDKKIIPSTDIILRAPSIAENKAQVPVEVTSNIAGTTRIILIGEEIDFPLIADFNLFEGAQGYVATRLSIAGSNNSPCGGVTTLMAIVHAKGIAYSASKAVRYGPSHCNGEG